MNTEARQQSETIASVLGALAKMTVEQHAEKDSTLGDRYGPAWRAQWNADVRLRISHLVEAIATRQPDVLAQHTAWSIHAATARGMDGADCRVSLECLREVIHDTLPEAVSDVAVQCIDTASSAATAAPEPVSTFVHASNPQHKVLLGFLEGVLDGRPRDAERVVLKAAETGTPVRELYSHVLAPALAEVGLLWLLDRCTVADEHIATGAAESVMAMLRRFWPEAPVRGHTVLATSVSGDLHAVGIRMIADFLEMDGWSSICLGANTPTEDVLKAARVIGVDLLAVSVTSYLNLRQTADLVGAVRAAEDLASLPVLLGGAPINRIPALLPEIGADATALTPEEAVEIANRVVAA